MEQGGSYQGQDFAVWGPFLQAREAEVKLTQSQLPHRWASLNRNAFWQV